MAETTEVSKDIDFELNYTAAMLNELREFAANWDELHEAERASWCLDWDQFVGTRWRSLERHAAAGVMTPEQAMKYQNLQRQFEEEGPTIRRLDLWLPAFPKRKKHK